MASSKRHALEILRVALPLIILAGGAGGFMAIGSRRDPGARTDTGAKAPLVETMPVEPHESGMVIETDGLVVPYREITIFAEVAGRVEYKAPELRTGKYVTKDVVLLRIDPSSYKLEVDRLTSEVNQAQAELDELTVEEHSAGSLLELATEQLALEEKAVARVQRLMQKNVIGEAEIDTARQSLLTAQNNVTTLRNQLQMIRTRRNRLEWGKKLAEARLHEAERDLSHTEIRAPLEGVVISDAVEEQGYVQPGAAVATIEDTAAVEVRCSLRMEELQWIWQQGPVGSVEPGVGPGRNYTVPHVAVTVVYSLGGKQYAWDGVLARYDGIGLDEKTRTMPCRVLVDDPTKSRLVGQEGFASDGPPALVRGMFVAVQIHTDPGLSLLKVPERAVRPGDGSSMSRFVVWRVRDGKLDVVRVTAAQILDDGLLVVADRAGLARGDRVVISPLSAVQNGMAVREGNAL